MIKNEFVWPTQISEYHKNKIDDFIFNYKKTTALNKAV